MRKCICCGIEKEISEFNKNYENKDHISLRCKDCCKKKIGIKKKCSICKKIFFDFSNIQAKKTCSNSCRRKLYFKNPSIKFERLLSMRLRTFKLKGILFTENEKELIRKKLQIGKCDLCKKETKFRDLYIDHDHKTNRFRGMLCSRCNFVLCEEHESIEYFKRVINYLEK